MKNLHYSFKPTTIISLVLFITDMIMLVINQASLNIWSYLIISGFLPIVLLAIFNMSLLRQNNIQKIIFALLILVIIESLIIILFSNFIDLNSVMNNTKTSGTDFSMQISIDHNLLSNFMTTFIPIFGLSFLLFPLIRKIKGGE